VLIEFAAPTVPGFVKTEKDGDARNPHPKDVSNNTFAGLRIFSPQGAHHLNSRSRSHDAMARSNRSSPPVERSLEGTAAARNWAYFETYDAWEDWSMSGKPQAFMLFDLQADPEQLRNIYPSTDEATRSELKRRLHQQLTCQGGGCA
jgi:hypothetical protein